MAGERRCSKTAALRTGVVSQRRSQQYHSPTIRVLALHKKNCEHLASNPRTARLLFDPNTIKEFT
jgi:hypothetical protein